MKQRQTLKSDSTKLSSRPNVTYKKGKLLNITLKTDASTRKKWSGDVSMNREKANE